jgi:hypothetical protein
MKQISYCKGKSVRTSMFSSGSEHAVVSVKAVLHGNIRLTEQCVIGARNATVY